jgi:hypothetical protein
MPEPRQIDELARLSAERYHREQSMMFGEASINLMATSMSIREVINWLRAQADMLEEFG